MEVLRIYMQLQLKLMKNPAYTLHKYQSIFCMPSTYRLALVLIEARGLISQQLQKKSGR